jgi:hypothetical protein
MQVVALKDALNWYSLTCSFWDSAVDEYFGAVKSQYDPSQKAEEVRTIFMCSSCASGSCAPPVILLKTREMRSTRQCGAPCDSVMEVSETGRMNIARRCIWGGGYRRHWYWFCVYGGDGLQICRVAADNWHWSSSLGGGGRGGTTPHRKNQLLTLRYTGPRTVMNVLLL